jgi:Clostripain family/Domain of unknown function (DUF4864)
MEQTANQTSPPGSPKKKKWPKILGGMVAFIILAVGLGFYFTAGMAGVVEKQLDLLRQGDIKGAYSLTSKDFHKATSLEQFTAFVKQYPSLSQNQGHTFSTRSIENNIGTVKGTLTAKDGAVTPVEFQLVKEQEEWRILFIEVRAAGTGIKEEEKSGKGRDPAPAPPLAASIVSVTTCEGVTEPGMKALGVRSEFSALSPEIHALVQLKNVKAGSKLKGSWIAVDAIDEPNYVIKSYTIDLNKKQGDVTAHFTISKPTNGWPPGKYKLDLYLDGTMAGSAPFTISKTAKPGASSEVSTASPKAAAGPMDLGPVKKDPKRIWTIAVYMGADNDLDPFALKDLKEMERGLPEEGVECIVLVDRAKGPTTAGDDRTDRVVRIKRNTDKDLKSEVLARPGEINTADPAVLQGFLSAVIKTFPAQHYALIMWDHGGGWASHLNDTDAPGTAKGYDHLSLPKLRQGISAALKDTGLKKLDLVGFDMCLMGQMETAVELADLAQVMVASQALEPGDGWPYEEILPSFGKESLGARRLGAQIVDAFGKHYGGRKEQVATLSAVDLGEVQKLAEALNALTAKIDQTVPVSWPAISRAFFYSESYADRTDIRKGTSGLSSVDLLDLLKRLRHAVAPFPADKEYQDIVGIMDRAVIASSVTPRHRLSHGLAIYAPTTSQQYNAQYEQVQLAKTSAWPKLLATLHQTQKNNLSTPKISDIKVVDAQSGQPVKGGKPGGGFRIEATVEGENVLWVQYLQAQRDQQNKGIIILEKSYVLDPNYHKRKLDAVADVVDLIMPEFKGNRNKVSREFVGMHLMVTNGERAARATIDGSNLADLAHVAVPVFIKRKDMESHFATVFFNAVTWQATNVVGEIPQPDKSISYRQIKPQPDDEVTLLFEFIPDEGQPGYLKGETFKWKEGLEFLINADSPGEVIVAMRAESIGGKSTFAKTNLLVEGYSQQEQQYVENAKKLTSKDLVGTWRWHGLKDGKWQPLPAYTEIAPDKSNPKVLIAKIHNPQDPKWKVTSQAVVLDTRLKPTLRLLSFDESGRPAEAMNFTVLVSRWEQGSPRMVLKYLVPKGWLVLWAKEKPGAASTPGAATLPPAAEPDATPSSAPQASTPPPAVVSLVGSWRSQDGEVLRIGDSTYESYELNQLVDKGTYELRKNLILTRSSLTGLTGRFSYRLQGQQLSLRDSDGETFHYRRIP